MKLPRKTTKSDPKMLAGALGAGLAVGAVATVLATAKGPTAVKAAVLRAESWLEKKAE